jgi:hypothetical protein
MGNQSELRSGSDLVDATYIPLFSSLYRTLKPLKIIPASHVTSDSGTGLVHCAPAHGIEDYNAFRVLGLISATQDILCHVNGAGKFTEEVANVVGEVAGKSLIDQEVLHGGSKAVVDLLRNIGCLVKIQRIKHRYPYDWKTNEPTIMTLVFIISFYPVTHYFSYAVQLPSGLRIWTISRTTLWRPSTMSHSSPPHVRFVSLPKVVGSLTNLSSSKPTRVIHSVAIRMVHFTTTRLGCPNPRTVSHSNRACCPRLRQS